MTEKDRYRLDWSEEDTTWVAEIYDRRQARYLTMEEVAGRLNQLGEDADKLRRSFARYLAPAYLENHTSIADICDNSLGALLGYVRDEADALREAGRD